MGFNQDANPFDPSQGPPAKTMRDGAVDMPVPGEVIVPGPAGRMKRSLAKADVRDVGVLPPGFGMERAPVEAHRTAGQIAADLRALLALHPRHGVGAPHDAVVREAAEVLERLHALTASKQ